MPFEFFFPKTFYYRDDLLPAEKDRTLIDAARELRREFPDSTRPNLYTTYGSLASVFAREVPGRPQRAGGSTRGGGPDDAGAPRLNEETVPAGRTADGET